MNETDPAIRDAIRRAMRDAWELGFNDGQQYGLRTERWSNQGEFADPYDEPSRPSNPYDEPSRPSNPYRRPGE